MYKVEFTPQALEDISRTDKAVADRIIKKIDWLSQNYEVLTPEPLKGKFEGLYKLVAGDWRILYTFGSNNKIITIHLIRHRRDVYK